MFNKLIMIRLSFTARYLVQKYSNVKVYDVTSFLSEHPGGKKVLLKVAGTDASKQFDQFHNLGVLEKFGPKLLKGDFLKAGASDSVVQSLHQQEEAPQGLVEGEAFGDLVPFGGARDRASFLIIVQILTGTETGTRPTTKIRTEKFAQQCVPL